jgi:hypothetical protein
LPIVSGNPAYHSSKYLPCDEFCRGAPPKQGVRRDRGLPFVRIALFPLLSDFLFSIIAALRKQGQLMRFVHGTVFTEDYS